MKLECGIKCSISELEEGSKYGGLPREFSEGGGGGGGGGGGWGTHTEINAQM